MFVADGANSVLANMSVSFFRISIFVRALAQGYFLFLLLRTRQGLLIWLMLGFFYLVFLIGTVATLDSLYSFEEYHFFDNFNIINKMMFFFICFAVFKQYFQTLDERNRLFKVFEILLLVQASVIIISFIFHLEIFAAYSVRADSSLRLRFGYQGLIPAQNEISAFFLIAFFYFFLKVIYLKKGMFALITVTIAALFTGTKVIIILPAILLLYMSLSVLGQALRAGKINRLYFLTGGVLLLLIVAVVWQYDYILSRLSPTISYYTYQASQDPSGSLLNVLAAPGRRLKIQRLLTDYLPQFNFLNYLFGGIDLQDLATETDFVDIFARLGLVGGLVFYLAYIKALTFPNGAISLTRLLFIGVWLGVSMTAGHIAYTAINGGYLAILLLVFLAFERRSQIQIQSEKMTDILNPMLALSDGPAYQSLDN